MTLPISRFPVPELGDLPADLREALLAVQEKAGFVPNVFLVLGHRPDELRAFMAYHDALMLRPPSSPNGLTKGEKEMIVVATSGANRCLYCVVSHGAILRIYEKNPILSDQLATNPLKADLTPRQHALIAFAMKASLASHELVQADFDALHAHGFTDEDAWDIGAIAAFFSMSNRMANLTSMRPNAEFHLMGRVPRAPKAD